MENCRLLIWKSVPWFLNLIGWWGIIEKPVMAVITDRQYTILVKMELMVSRPETKGTFRESDLNRPLDIPLNPLSTLYSIGICDISVFLHNVYILYNLNIEFEPKMDIQRICWTAKALIWLRMCNQDCTCAVRSEPSLSAWIRKNADCKSYFDSADLHADLSFLWSLSHLCPHYFRFLPPTTRNSPL